MLATSHMLFEKEITIPTAPSSHAAEMPSVPERDSSTEEPTMRAAVTSPITSRSTLRSRWRPKTSTSGTSKRNAASPSPSRRASDYTRRGKARSARPASRIAPEVRSATRPGDQRSATRRVT